MIIFWQRNEKAFIFYDESEGTSMYKCVYGHHVDEVVHFALGALVCVFSFKMRLNLKGWEEYFTIYISAYLKKSDNG